MLPSVAAAVLSVGVETRHAGDLAPGEAVSSRREVPYRGGGPLVELENGKGSVCTSAREIEDRIWIRGIGLWLLDWVSATVAEAAVEGRIERIKGLTKAVVLR